VLTYHFPTRRDLLAARVGAERSAHRDAIKAILRAAGSDAPALDAEFDARLGLVVQRLLAKFLVARR
jgi:hypothetical protein